MPLVGIRAGGIRQLISLPRPKQFMPMRTGYSRPMSKGLGQGVIFWTTPSEAQVYADGQ